MKKIIIIIIFITLFLVYLFIGKNYIVENFFNTNEIDIKTNLMDNKKENNINKINLEKIEKQINKDLLLEYSSASDFIDKNTDEVSGYDDRGFCLKGVDGDKWLRIDFYFDTGKKKIIQLNQYVLKKKDFDDKCDNGESVVFDNPKYAKGRYFKCSEYLNSKKNCNLK